MRSIISLRMIFILVLISTLAGPALAQKEATPELLNQEAASTSTAWRPEVIDSEGSTGVDASLTLDPADGTPYIAYFDETNGDLRLASHVVIGGNCGPSNTWWCRTVPVPDTATKVVGKYASVDMYRPDGNLLVYYYKLGIAFIDDSDQSVWLAEYRDMVMGTDEWTFTKVNSLGFLPTRKHVQLRYSYEGTPYIVYHQRTANINLVYTEYAAFAKYVGTGGNCGETGGVKRWQCDTLLSGEQTGRYPSIAFSKANTPTITFYDAKNNLLVLARPSSTPGSCGPGNSWYCFSVDFGGVSSSVWVNPDDASDVRIGYYNPQTGDLRYAVYSGGSVASNCGMIDLKYYYTCETVETMASNPVSMPPVSIDVNSAGITGIAYEYISTDPAPAALKYARPAATYNGIPLGGNCGSGSGLFMSWVCTMLDGGGSYVEEAFDVSLAYNQNDRPLIVYSEWNDYDAVYRLKFARQLDLLFLPILNKEMAPGN